MTTLNHIMLQYFIYIYYYIILIWTYYVCLYVYFKGLFILLNHNIQLTFSLLLKKMLNYLIGWPITVYS